MKSNKFILSFYHNKMHILLIFLLIFISNIDSYKSNNYSSPYYYLIDQQKIDYTNYINKLILSCSLKCLSSNKCNANINKYRSRISLLNNFELILLHYYNLKYTSKMTNNYLKNNDSIIVADNLLNDFNYGDKFFKILSNLMFNYYHDFMYNLYTFKDFSTKIKNYHRIEYSELVEKNFMLKPDNLTDSFERFRFLSYVVDIAINNAYTQSKPIKSYCNQKLIYSYMNYIEEKGFDHVKFTKRNYADKILLLNLPIKIVDKASFKENISKLYKTKNSYHIYFKIVASDSCKVYEIDEQNRFLKPYSMYKIIRTVKVFNILVIVARCLEDDLKHLKEQKKNTIKGLDKFFYR